METTQTGLRNVTPPPFMRDIIRQFEAAHVYAFQLTFVLMGLVALVGAIMSWLLVRQTDREGFPRTSSPGARGGPGLAQEKDQG